MAKKKSTTTARKTKSKSTPAAAKKAKKAKVEDEFEDEETKSAPVDFDGFTAEQLEGYKERLLKERDAVEARLKEHISSAVADNDSLPDELDQAARHADQAYLLRLADKERKLLNEINRALGKFEFGEYGICEGTGEYIEPKRLELRPWTRYSVQYKEDLERQKKNLVK